VHSIALGLFEDRDKIHWFRDIGYQHIPFFNCPTRPKGKCKGCKPGLFSVSYDSLGDEGVVRPFDEANCDLGRGKIPFQGGLQA